MSAADSSTPANTEASVSADPASSPTNVWEPVPSRTPSVSEAGAEVDTIKEAAEAEAEADRVEEATANLSLSNAGPKKDECKHSIVEVIAEWESDFVLYKSSEGKTLDFMVSREILRITSPVLRELIDRNSRDVTSIDGGDDSRQPHNRGSCERCGNRNGQNSLYLEGDDYDALLNMLQIVHCRPSNSLLDASFDLVKSIAVVCERYKWQEAIIPWKKIWIDEYLPHILEPGYEDWLRVAKIFEIEEETTRLMEIMGNECSALYQSRKPGRKYMVRSGKNVYTDLWPQEAIDQIMKIRATRLKRLVDSVNELKGFLYHIGTSELCELEVCTSLAYGSLLRSTKREKISEFLSNPGGWQGSALYLRKRIKKIEFATYSNISLDHLCRINFLRERFNSYVEESDLSDGVAWDGSTTV